MLLIPFELRVIRLWHIETGNRQTVQRADFHAQAVQSNETFGMTLVVNILLTKGGMPEATFFDYLMSGVWYPTLVQRYYESAYQAAYQSAMEQIIRSKMITRSNGYLYGVSSNK